LDSQRSHYDSSHNGDCLLINGRRIALLPASVFCSRLLIPCGRGPGPTSFEELRSSHVSGFQPSTSRSPGMITYASSPVPKNAPMMRISLSTMMITHASAETPSAQVSILVRIESSSYDEIATCWREKFTKYNSPLGSWHFRVAEKVSPSASWTALPPCAVLFAAFESIAAIPALKPAIVL